MIFMKKVITVTDAARNFADCVSRARYQNVTYILLKGGTPVARLVPDNEKVCTGRELASALNGARLPAQEARAWAKDLRDSRRSLKPVSDKWQ